VRVRYLEGCLEWPNWMLISQEIKFAGISHDFRVSEHQLPIGQRYCLSGGGGTAAVELMDRMNQAAI
jgi:hypothetical protein